MDRSIDILIVEDRSIVAAKIKRELERAGFAIAGMAATQAAAMDLAERLKVQAAILDIDLRGQPIYPVADILYRRGIPFLFLTGYSHVAVPSPWQDILLVEKPFEPIALIRTLRSAMAGEAAQPAPERATTPAIQRAWDRVRHTRDILTEQRAWAEQHLGRDAG